jgi:hypothetical protein
MCVYAYYLDAMWMSYLHSFIDVTKMYTESERNAIEYQWYIIHHSFVWNMLEPETFHIAEPTTYYIFKIDYPTIRLNNEELFKELVEYVFHPNRVLRLGGHEYLEHI